MREIGHAEYVEEKRNVHNGLVGKPGRKRLLGRQGRRWDYTIEMDIRATGWGCKD
jgi:hypothetical protein